MSEAIRILVIEDAEEDALLLMRNLRNNGFESTFRIIDRIEEMERSLREESWDLIVTDYTLPNFSGLRALEVWKASGVDISFIVVSGRIGEETAVETMKAGALDYIMKGNLTRFSQAVRRELREAWIRAEHHRIEEQLRLTERLRYVGAVAATIMHDFKQPMQVIMSCAEFFKSDDLEPEERLKCIEDIVKYVKMLFNMSQEILYYTGGDSRLKPAPIDVDQPCQELVETYQKPLSTDRIMLRYAIRSKEMVSPVIAVDRDRIWRALVNLITNAVDAMPHGGEIRLRLQLEVHEARLEIQDSGNGILETIRESLFEPFITEGKRQGTRRGLAIVKSIVEAHRGSISFTTQPDEGTTFRISLPRQLELAGKTNAGASAQGLPEKEMVGAGDE